MGRFTHPFKPWKRRARGVAKLTAAPGHQSDSALACSSAPHPSDPQPPNLTTKREKTDIPTLLSADAGLRYVIASTATVAVLRIEMGSRSLGRSDEGGLKSLSVRGERTESRIFSAGQF